MHIELKNFKYFASLSEETEAFSATVYVNGSRAFMVENTGKGECHRLTPVNGKTHDDIRHLNQWVSTLPEVDLGNGIKAEDDLDYFISRLVDDLLLSQELKKLLKKLVLLYSRNVGANGLIQLASKLKPAVTGNLRDKIQVVYRDCIIINDLPFHLALEFYKNSNSNEKLHSLYLKAHKAS